MLGDAITVLDMASWIETQMDVAQTPISSHREYFRKRLNPRLLELMKYGRSGPHACEGNSRWRNFAFTRKDKGELLYDLVELYVGDVHAVSLGMASNQLYSIPQ